MPEINVLPNQRSKLGSEVEQTRYIGVEMEFHPGPVVQWDWRHQLYAAGIDTFDDGCQTRSHYSESRSRTFPSQTDVCGVALRSTEYYRTIVDCTASLCGTHPRASHIQQCLRLSHNTPDFEEFLRLMGATTATERSALQAGVRGRDPSVLARIAAMFPRPTTRNQQLWNLGTDPTAGLELRMAPMSVNERPFDAIKRACTAIDDGGGEANHSCGLHVHIDMRDKSSLERYRLAVGYLMCEPLLLAAVSPHRYHNGYNRPLFGRGAVITLPTPSGNLSSFSQHNELLNFSALIEHGTVEWRQLEGTLNGDVIKNWAILALRFTEACKNPWGVKLSAATPIGVTPDSIRGLLKFMDLNRSDLSDDLKGARDWYIDRVRQFGDRTTFQRRITVGGNRSLSALRALKESGVATATGSQIAWGVGPLVTNSPTEVGSSFLRFIQHLTGAGGMQDPTGLSPLDYLHTNETTAQQIAIIAREHFTIYHENDQADPHDDAPEEILVSSIDDSDWREFARAIYNHDADACGTWLNEYVLGPYRDETLNALNHVLTYWMGFWCYQAIGQDTVARIFQRNTGNSTCVDF